MLHDRYRWALLLNLHARPILDLDSSVLTVYGRQERSAVGFNPRKRGRPSYLAILSFEGQTRDCLDGELVPGNTHVLKVIMPVIERALGKLPTLTGLRVRADEAFYDGALFDWLEARRLGYVVPARITTPIKHRLSGLRYRRIRPGVWSAEFRHRVQSWEKERRFVVIRRPVPTEPTARLHLFQMEGYTY
jgi:hypothetical protein